MDFSLPAIEDNQAVVSKRDYKRKPALNNLKVRSRPKLNSMPLKENKLFGSLDQKYKVEDYYTLISVIGTGTYAKVYLATSKQDEKKVAVKISRGKTAGKYLKEEFELLKSIDDPTIPKAIEFKENFLKNTTYLVMEYFEGQTLDEFVAQEGVIGEDQALICIKSLTACVARLHKLGVAHRDIKPQNILINQDFEIKLIDFNISKKGKDLSTPAKFSKRFMTQISSPLFAAPEILSPEFYTESVDIWGIGIVFITMLFGMNVFTESEKLSTLEIHENFMNTIKEKYGLSDSCKNITTLTMAYESESRPTAEELIALL